MPTHNLEDQPESAIDVVSDIFTNGFDNRDIFDWKSFDCNAQSELITDLIATIASYEYDQELSVQENRGERLVQIEECIWKHLIAAAKREGYIDPLMSNDPRD